MQTPKDELDAAYRGIKGTVIKRLSCRRHRLWISSVCGNNWVHFKSRDQHMPTSNSNVHFIISQQGVRCPFPSFVAEMFQKKGSCKCQL